MAGDEYETLVTDEVIQGLAKALQSAHDVDSAIWTVVQDVEDADWLADELKDWIFSRMDERSIHSFHGDTPVSHVAASLCVLDLSPHGAVLFGLTNMHVIETVIISFHASIEEAQSAREDSDWWPPGWEQ